MHICSMVNRGAIAEKAFIKSGLAKGFVAEQLNIDRRTLTSRLQRPDLDYDFILELYKVLRLDVTEDFPELSRFQVIEETPNLIDEDRKEKFDLENCKGEIEMWKSKYFELLEKYNHKYTKLLEEYNLILKEKNGFSKNDRE